MKKNILYLLILFFLKLFSPIIFSQNSNEGWNEGANKDANNEAWNRYESQQKAYQKLESKRMQELIQASDDYSKEANKEENKKQKRKKKDNLKKEVEDVFMESKANYKRLSGGGVSGVGNNTIDISTEDLTIGQEVLGSFTSVDASNRYVIEEFKKGPVYQRRILLNNISPIKINDDKKFDLGNPINNVFKLLNQIYNFIFS